MVGLDLVHLVMQNHSTCISVNTESMCKTLQLSDWQYLRFMKLIFESMESVGDLVTIC